MMLFYDLILLFTQNNSTNIIEESKKDAPNFKLAKGMRNYSLEQKHILIILQIESFGNIFLNNLINIQTVSHFAV